MIYNKNMEFVVNEIETGSRDGLVVWEDRRRDHDTGIYVLGRVALICDLCVVALRDPWARTRNE